MSFDNVLHDRQTKPCPACCAASSRVGAIKAPCKMGDMLGVDSLATVSDNNIYPIAFFRPNLDLDRLVWIAVFERIVGQVANQLFELLAITVDHDRRIRHCDVEAGFVGVMRVDHLYGLVSFYTARKPEAGWNN